MISKPLVNTKKVTEIKVLVANRFKQVIRKQNNITKKKCISVPSIKPGTERVFCFNMTEG